ncbi:hypothetical protein LTR91_021322 [Friedmanniomyces endolithicus]|uniref:Uncharacterized protein n=1 Tax=Friedmanniomyces endolithicus TaxID=329885 RepID=A0AAN6K0B5_9PEZI|nr:hypothetical protein LTR94_015181 [Friedmanniomyces endolithicus]KAK0780173.1 hypothetical protein LTR38_014171 [Friedmanniomyces endolithicus]KAK0791840.1 hypothetical protein LTR59_008776 [Friedmanniomyces endolithicus]KAK0835359.1 hypothetical protein LTR03_013991 [Friedmanniomyces endolithicus]KAK0852574.1 hypothetical protein LTS02_012307 [Friedmanniomyces endolithicus]
MDATASPALLMLDLPEQALAGIDLLAFTTTPRFKGVKAIPPGLHLAFVGANTAFSERHGIWFQVPHNLIESGPPLTITRWQSSSESLVAVIDEAEHLKWRANLGGIWREGLTPYRQTTAKTTGEEDEQDELVDWTKLTSHITEALLTRITGSKTWTLSSGSSAKRDLEDIPGLDRFDVDELQSDKELAFLPIDLKRTWRPGATGRERTEAAQDRSWALNEVIEKQCSTGDSMEVVGEMQFCFLCVLTLNNFSCFEQWKRILTLLFTSRSAAATSPEVFVQAIRALTLQLQHCRVADTGLIDLADEGGSLLKGLLTRFRTGLESLQGSIGVQDVVDELDDLEDYLRTEHGWQFGGTFAKSGVLELEDGEQVRMDTTAFDEEDEAGEYAPQVVELTAEQARMLGADLSGGEVRVEINGLRAGVSRASLHEVVDSSDDDDEEEVEGEHKEATVGGTSESEGEEAADLEDMDARY